MPLVNQGWFVRCDECGEADKGYIGLRTQAEAIAEARRSGWLRSGKLWFCSKECRAAYREARLAKEALQ